MAYTNPFSLSQDVDGWTQFTPGAGARLFYISESGTSDPTNDYYSPAEVGGDPFEPDGNMDDPYDTYANVIASGYVRDGNGDYILFKRGDTFTARILKRNGASDTDYAVVGAYGSSGANPIINPTGATTIPLYLQGTFQRFAVTGLDFYHTTRDPGSGDYVGTTGCRGIDVFADTGETIRQLIIEGCKFRFFSNNIIQNNVTGTLEEIAFRRNVVLDNYVQAEHAHGLYVGYADTFLLEENIFDHNGWYEKSGTGEPSLLYHGIYISSSDDVLLLRNIITRSSSGGTKVIAYSGTTDGVEIDNNLYIDGEIGLDIGDSENLGGTNLTITNNIFTNIDRDPPTERDIGWGMVLSGIDVGTVSDNIIMKFENSSVTFTLGIMLENGDVDLTIEDNIIYSTNSHGNADDGRFLYVATGGGASGNVIQNNLFQEPVDDYRIYHFAEDDDLSAFTFLGNTYYAASEVFDLEVGNKTFAEWVVITSDTSSWSSYNCLDATRDIETYMASLGQTETIAAFINKCRAQNRYNWDTDYTASVTNTWIRAGFWEVEPEYDFNTSIKIKFN